MKHCKCLTPISFRSIANFCKKCDRPIESDRDYDKNGNNDLMKCDTVKNFDPDEKFYVYDSGSGTVFLEYTSSYAEKEHYFKMTTLQALCIAKELKELAESIIEKESRLGNSHA